MTVYIIKSLCTFEIEAVSNTKALEIFNQGLWDQSDVVDEDAYELGYYDEDGHYKTLIDKE